MDIPDWINFKRYPKKVFEVLTVIAVVIAVFWGVVNWDTNKGLELFKTELQIISQPISNNIVKKIERFNTLTEIISLDRTISILVGNSFKHLNQHQNINAKNR